MATINKDFKVKSGLIVEGLTATVNGYDVLTKKQADQDYIVNLIGGTATSQNTPDTVVKRDGSGNFAAGEITADLIGNVDGTVSSISNHNTDELDEGTSNKYFTNQRALDATSAAYDAAGSATNAYNDAIAWAQNYTDSEIADEVTNRNNAINNALTTAESYADTVAGNALDSANSYTDSSISTEVTNRNSAIATAKSEAISTASSDATSKANAALADANDYTDTEISALEGRSQSYADTAATNAENAAKAYADGLSSGLNWKAAVNVLATSNVALSGSTPLSIDNHTVSNGYRVLLKGQSTDSENGIYEMSISGGSYTLSRPTDADAYSELVGAAVFVMEGDNYASTAWVQADHYLSSFAGQTWTQFSGQGTYLAGNGLVLDGTTFEIDTDITATKLYADGVANAALQDANTYTDNREVAITTAYENYADGVGTSANGYTDSQISTEVTNRNNAIDSAISTEVTNRNNAIATAKSEAISTAEGYADGLIADEIVDRNNAITNAINALSTTDIEEGTNLYYTDARAKAEAASLLANATKTNIIITKDGSNNLTITAENGVADSTTDDLDEGSTNLYFTNQRVLNAVDNATITPLAVEINNYRKEEATQQYVGTASTVNVHTISYPYESVKYLVRVVGWSGGVKHSQITEILMTVDGNNNIAITEYGTVCTDAANLASFSAALVGGNATLTATTAVNGVEIIAAATMLSWAD